MRRQSAARTTISAGRPMARRRRGVGRAWTAAALVLALAFFVSCRRQSSAAPGRPQAKAYGTAIVGISGSNQIAAAGSLLGRPLVVGVSDATDEPVVGAAVVFSGPAGVRFTPAAGLTDQDGQITTTVTLATIAGRYRLAADTWDKTGKQLHYRFEETALDYEQGLGQQLSEQYCVRCHDPESTPARVSNYVNLATPPAPFTKFEVLNALSDDELANIIARGGAANGRSPEMPAWGRTLAKSDIRALVSYIRAIARAPESSADSR